MNIFIPAIEYPPNTIGGTGTFYYYLARILKKTGHTVVIITQVKKATLNDDIKIYPLCSLEEYWYTKPILHIKDNKHIRRFLNTYFPNTSKIILYNFLFLLTFFPLHRKYNFQVIHSTPYLGVFLLVSLFFPKIPRIIHVQGPEELLQPFDFITFDSKLRAKFESLLITKVAHAIVPCSKSINQYLLRSYKNIKNKIVYIPNTIEVNTTLTKTKPIDTNTLIFWGRMEYRKGPDLLVKAFTKLSHLYPNLELILIGENAHSWIYNGVPHSFKNYIQVLNIPEILMKKITFVSPIYKRERLLKLLNNIRGVAILPSRYEPFGYVYIEAMMTGCITIASDRGAGEDIVTNAIDGFVIRPDVNEIVKSVEKIKKLTTTQLTSIQLSAREKIINSYSSDKAVIKYISLYKSLFGN